MGKPKRKNPEMRRLSVAEAAYIAGLVDGEGYIGITANRTSKNAKGCKRGVAFRTMISIRMCVKHGIDFAFERTAVGKINFCKTKNDKGKDCWQWNVWSNQAADLAAQLLPFLTVKRAQAENLIRFQSIMRLPGKLGLTDEEWDKRIALHAVSAHLNKRGQRRHEETGSLPF